MKIIAIIPARGGSKGVPRKNIKMIAGHPLVAHSIMLAQKSPSISRIFVSTEDAEIAGIVKSYGAEVVPRPLEIAHDKATSTSALLHAINYLRDTENYEADLIVFLQPTSPYRQPDDIENAIKKLKEDNADSLLSTSPFHGFLWRDHDGKFDSYNYDHTKRPRRQDAPKDMVENGSIYVLKPWVLRDLNDWLGGKITYYEQGLFETFQIDEPDDFLLIETIMEKFSAKPLLPEIKKIKMVVFDFDGVMTDNKVIVDQDGKEYAICDRGDGWGIGKLKKTGKEVIIISTEKNPIVAARARKLNLECHHDCDDKLTLLKEIAKTKNINADEIVYVGNDENDLSCMQWVGFPIAVENSVNQVKHVAKYVTKSQGGDGAVREVCELMISE
jgi:YrbI family 3-deoxy-D-manno-octulosonate 8-phosphate phosphatase